MSRDPMKPLAKRVWKRIVAELRRVDASVDRDAYYTLIAGFVRQESRALGPELMARYGLDALADLCPGVYPLELSGFDVTDEARHLARQSPSSLEVIAMLLRDQLWDLVSFRAGEECDGCSDGCVRLVADVARDRALVLACDQCGWAQLLAGGVWEGRASCVPATTAELRAAGFREPCASLSDTAHRGR